MKRQITCVVCPRGCLLTAEVNGADVTVTGHGCPRGEEHARSECLNPVRSLTSVVRVSNREDTMVSVKSAAPVPKGKLFEIMGKIRTLTVEAPVKLGDVILSDVYGTEIVATKSID